jgi:hypothetical protein
VSLFFRQILILRHYVNYIEEKQDKSSIFLSSSVHTQAGVDIKILSGHSSSNVLYHVVALPSAAARSLKRSSSSGGGVNASIGGSGVSTIGRLLLSAANGVADHHHHLLRRVMAK